MSPTHADDAAALLGRLLLAALFVPSGIAKLAGFAGVSAALAAKGLPLPALCAAAAIALELAGSALMVAGWGVRGAALALAGFCLVSGVLFHDFWNAAGPAVLPQRQAFFKNLGLCGGLLLLAGRGPGRFAWRPAIRTSTP